MGKKKSTKQPSTAEPDSDTNNDNDTPPPIQGYVEDEELELLQVDLGDMVKMKQVLDESVSAAVLEHVTEEYHWDNIKLLVMFAACVFAMIAQFAPIPFPESRPVLGVCGSLYFLLSGVLQLITTFVDKDSILWTKPVEATDPRVSKNADLTQYGWKIRSKC